MKFAEYVVCVFAYSMRISLLIYKCFSKELFSIGAPSNKPCFQYQSRI